MPQCVSISFFRFSGIKSKLWAFAMMGLARAPMARVPDATFWKLCGSGTGEGFTPLPNTAVYAILCVWPSEDLGRVRIESESIFARYRSRSTESWTVFLSPRSVKGNWAGQTPFVPAGTEATGPLAALTRATIKPRILHRFWGRVPSISQVIGSDPNVAFKIGIGEVPWLHQVTFSIWPSAQAMADFARKPDGPHAQAIRAVRDGAWFKEELYARFTVTGDSGTWGGTSPLNKLKDAA